MLMLSFTTFPVIGTPLPVYTFVYYYNPSWWAGSTAVTATFASSVPSITLTKCANSGSVLFFVLLLVFSFSF
jgi:hypothetical protein